MLLHKDKFHGLQSVEIVDACGVRYSGDAAQGQKRLPSEVVGCENIMVHDCEGDHGPRRTTLLQRYAKFETLVENWM